MRRSCGEFRDGGFEEGGIFARGLGVVDGAGADEDEQARIAMREDAADVEARVEDGGRRGFGDGAFFLKEHGRQDDGRPLNAEVFHHLRHGWVSHCLA